MAADTPRRGARKASSLALKVKAQVAAPARHSPHQNHLLAALPTLLVYFFGGQYFMRGLTAGALK